MASPWGLRDTGGPAELEQDPILGLFCTIIGAGVVGVLVVFLHRLLSLGGEDYHYSS